MADHPASQPAAWSFPSLRTSQSGRQHPSSTAVTSSASGSETVSISGIRSQSRREANSISATSGSGRSSTIRPSSNHHRTQQSDPSIMQTSIAAGQQPADYYQQDAAPTPNQGVLTQQPAGSQNRSQHSQSMPDTASAGPVQAVPSHINAMSEHRQDGRSRPQSEIAPESSVSQQASRQSRGRASRQAEGIAPKAPSRARSVRGEVRGYHNPGETFLSASNEPLQPQAHARNRLPQDEFQGGIRPPLRQGLVRGEADDYYDPNQNFSTAAPSRVNARPQPQAPNPAEQRTDGAEHQHGRRRHRHRHRRPIDQEDHEYFIARSTIPRGPLGYVKGLLHLLLNKSHVKDHTAERLDLLNRARKYFNSGLISSVPGFKEKKGRFEEEMCVVTETLLYQERERSRASRTGDHTNHEHDRFGRCKAASSVTSYGRIRSSRS